MNLTRRVLLPVFLMLCSSLIQVAWFFGVDVCLGHQSFGMVLLWIASVGVIALSDFGISTALIRFTAEAQAGSSEGWRWMRIATMLSLSLSLLASLAFIGTSLITGWPVPVTLTTAVAICIQAVGFQMGQLAISHCKGSEKMTTGAVISLINQSAAMIPSLFLAVNGARPELVFFIYSLGLLVSGVSSWWWCSSRFLCSGYLFARHEHPLGFVAGAKEIFACGIVLWPQSLAGVFMNHIQRFIVGWCSGVDAVPLVNFAFVIASRLHGLVNAGLEFLLPASSKNKFDEHMHVAVRRIVWGVAAPLFTLAVGVIVIVLFNTKNYSQVSHIFALFAVGTWMAVLCAPSQHVMNGYGRGKVTSIFSLAIPSLFLVVICAVFFVGEIMHARHSGLDLFWYPIAYIIAQVFVWILMPGSRSLMRSSGV